MPKSEKEFLALDVKNFLEKIRLEQMNYRQKSNYSEEVWERYEFLIAAVETEHLVLAVPAEQYYELQKKERSK